MSFGEFAEKLGTITGMLGAWRGLLVSLDRNRRLRIARYAGDIAATLARAALWAEALEQNSGDLRARRALIRELGRIQGYLETIVGVLTGHLDGRKLAGVKRRLNALGLPSEGAPPANWHAAASVRINQLVAAEGYFRALADGLRV